MGIGTFPIVRFLEHRIFMLIAITVFSPLVAKNNSGYILV